MFELIRVEPKLSPSKNSLLVHTNELNSKEVLVSSASNQARVACIVQCNNTSPVQEVKWVWLVMLMSRF